MERSRVTVELTGDEALVLFEWLAHFNERGHGEFVDQAEQRVLWDVEASLESVLATPFMADYGGHLEKARARVRDNDE